MKGLKMNLKTGSSPLARGLPTHWFHVKHASRIIPARAGFTLRPPLYSGRAMDHPRSRGVYLGVTAPILAAFGSSPLARGLRQAGPVDDVAGRIIPARAGFTF